MTAPTYTEVTLPGRRTFRLDGDVLQVECRWSGRVTSDEVALARVVGNSTRVKIRNAVGLKRAVTYIGILAVIGFATHLFFGFPSVWIALAVATLSIPALHVISYYARPVDVEQFKDADGKILFDFIYPKKRSRELEEFLIVLHASLLKPEPNQSLQPTGPSARG